jgi:hypothetical protein
MELFPRFPTRLIKQGEVLSLSFSTRPETRFPHPFTRDYMFPRVSKLRHPAVDFRISSWSLAEGRTKHLSALSPSVKRLGTWHGYRGEMLSWKEASRDHKSCWDRRMKTLTIDALGSTWDWKRPPCSNLTNFSSWDCWTLRSVTHLYHQDGHRLHMSNFLRRPSKS